MSYISFIFLSEDWLHIYVNLVTQRNLLFSRLGTVVRRTSGFWIRTIVNASRVESKYWHCFWGITVQQSVISGGYSFTCRLNKALILTPYLATQILFLTSFDLLDTSHFHFMVPLYQVTLCLEKVHMPFKRVVAITFSFLALLQFHFVFDKF